MTRGQSYDAQVLLSSKPLVPIPGLLHLRTLSHCVGLLRTDLALRCSTERHACQLYVPRPTYHSSQSRRCCFTRSDRLSTSCRGIAAVSEVILYSRSGASILQRRRQVPDLRGCHRLRDIRLQPPTRSTLFFSIMRTGRRRSLKSTVLSRQT